MEHPTITVRELITALCDYDLNLPVKITWEGIFVPVVPKDFEVINLRGTTTLSISADDIY